MHNNVTADDRKTCFYDLQKLNHFLKMIFNIQELKKKINEI